MASVSHILIAILCVFSGTVLQAESFDPLSFGSVIKLAEFAKEIAAPFTKTALERLHGHVFGSGRASRTTDVIIFNMSNKSFKLLADKKHECTTGGWTGSLLPEDKIFAHSSVAYGAQSYSWFYGATECSLHYRSTDGEASFEVTTSNPYIGRTTARGNGKGVRVKTMYGRGTNNNVRFILRDYPALQNVRNV